MTKRLNYKHIIELGIVIIAIALIAIGLLRPKSTSPTPSHAIHLSKATELHLSIVNLPNVNNTYRSRLLMKHNSSDNNKIITYFVSPTASKSNLKNGNKYINPMQTTKYVWKKMYQRIQNKGFNKERPVIVKFLYKSNHSLIGQGQTNHKKIEMISQSNQN